MIRPLIRIWLVIFSLFILTQPCFAAAANAAVGHVVWVRGTLKVGGRVLKQGSTIYVHDVLTTDAGSQAGITFTDNTLMTFKEGTQYSVDNYQFKKTSQSFTGSLLVGGFRTITGQIAKNNPGNYQVNTPVATIGVRGTDYQAVLKNGSLYVVVFDGMTCLKNNAVAPTNVGGEFQNWVNTPAVHMPQVLAIPDQRIKKSPAQLCLSAPVLVSPIPDIPGTILIPGTTLVNAGAHFSGSPLSFSVTFIPTLGSALNVPPNNISIDPNSGVVSVFIGAGVFGDYAITVTAANLCGSASSTFNVDYDTA